jgi:ATP-dependent DNA helicase RecQ
VSYPYSSPETTHAFFDLEATSTDVEQAEIVEIAAINPGGAARQWYVATVDEIPTDHETWKITKIDPEVYHRLKVSPKQALEEFLEFVGGRPLAGHNVLRYDLPLIRRHLNEQGLQFPQSELPVVDTLRWAHLLFPTPPDDLGGYSLGKLHEKLRGEPIADAHQALNDCRATLAVVRGLLSQSTDPVTLKLWSWLELPEVHWYGQWSTDTDELKDLLRRPARVRWVSEPGRDFPHIDRIGTDLLESRRPGQDQMMRAVAHTFSTGQRTLIQAPTGTGKTRGYLYPAHFHSQQDGKSKTIIATHTKVLQQQALDELQRSADLGYQARAVAVKSPRDYICLEALFEAIEAKPENLEERYALGVLGHYAQRGDFDLGAIPPFWDQSAAYREVRFSVQTNPNRCRPECPFSQYCAYQTDLRQREQADFWVTNQAWLMAHLGHSEPEDEAHAAPINLVIDEAHNLEDVATQAFSQTFGEEDSRLHLLRIFDERRRRGWLRDNSRVPEGMQEKANQIRRSLIPSALEKLELYSAALTQFLKQHGRGDLQFGLSLALGPEIRKKPEWAKLRILEDGWIAALKALRQTLLEFPRGSWLERNLRDSSGYFQQQIDLLFERRAYLREVLHEESNPNLIHLSEYHPETGWKHVATPIDITTALSGVWQQAQSLTLTSATLAVGGDFSYILRVLGLNDAQTVSIPEALPYEKAHLIIPRHLPESRTSTQRRFQSFYHIELETLLPRLKRSLTLFTSSQRMRGAKEYLENSVPDLYVPLTRREREDIALYMGDPSRRGAALGTRAYMEGVDFRDLEVVNLERIPFPIPTPLLEKRQELAKLKGLDPWEDVYLPKALLTFVQAFGRLVRDDRKQVGNGAFILWDKRLLNSSYQQRFFRALPKGVPNPVLPESRQDFYRALSDVLGLDIAQLPTEELRDENQIRLEQIRQSDIPPSRARSGRADPGGLAVDRPDEGSGRAPPGEGTPGRRTPLLPERRGAALDSG